MEISRGEKFSYKGREYLVFPDTGLVYDVELGEFLEQPYAGEVVEAYRKQEALVAEATVKEFEKPPEAVKPVEVVKPSEVALEAKPPEAPEKREVASGIALGTSEEEKAEVFQPRVMEKRESVSQLGLTQQIRELAGWLGLVASEATGGKLGRIPAEEARLSRQRATAGRLLKLGYKNISSAIKGSRVRWDVVFESWTRILTLSFLVVLAGLAVGVLRRFVFSIWGEGVKPWLDFTGFIAFPAHFLAMAQSAVVVSAIFLTLTRVWRKGGASVEALLWTVVSLLFVNVFRGVWVLYSINMVAYIATLVMLVFLAIVLSLTVIVGGVIMALIGILVWLASILGSDLAGLPLFIASLLVLLGYPAICATLSTFALYVSGLQGDDLTMVADYGLAILIGIFTLIKKLLPGLASLIVAGVVVISGILVASTREWRFFKLAIGAIVVYATIPGADIVDIMKPLWDEYVSFVDDPSASYARDALITVLRWGSP